MEITMNKYTIYCTKEQTKKALELGAPIKVHPFHPSVISGNERLFEGIIQYNNLYYCIPTTQQMIGWLEKEKGISVEVSRQYGINKYCYYVFDNCGNDIESLESKIKFNSRKDATLAGIDAALEYLSNNKSNMKIVGTTLTSYDIQSLTKAMEE